jgi:hypothetical protein
MVEVEEIQNAPGPIPFSMTLAAAQQIEFDLPMLPVETSRAERPGKLNVSDSEVLVRSASVFSVLGLFVWAVIKLWLFEA